MTTAHRATWHPAVASSSNGGVKNMQSVVVSARDISGHTQLKFRQVGQANSDELAARDLKAELLARESEHYSKSAKEKARTSGLLGFDPPPADDGPPPLTHFDDGDDSAANDSDSSTSQSASTEYSSSESDSSDDESWQPVSVGAFGDHQPAASDDDADVSAEVRSLTKSRSMTATSLAAKQALAIANGERSIPLGGDAVDSPSRPGARIDAPSAVAVTRDERLRKVPHAAPKNKRARTSLGRTGSHNDREKLASSSDDDDSSDSDDEHLHLLQEIRRMKAEKAAEAAAAAASGKDGADNGADEDLLRANPLLAAEVGLAVKGGIKRRWDDDVVFKNQARDTGNTKKKIVNDVVRSDFHKNFLKQFMR